ncbi:MAG: GHMP kinase [Flavobacteriaceae bacterium]|nr:GHMP kinase [Flavobacteriaceae bacterium]
MKQSYSANGKLLISGEYAVLDGALALAVPCKQGQTIEVSNIKTSKEKIHWLSYLEDGSLWYEDVFSLLNFEPTKQNDPVSKILETLLKQARKLNANFLVNENLDIRVETYLEFPRLWGFGSSSTLISCIAQWAKVNPFELLHAGFGGSGYDIACATATSPILYKKTSASDPYIQEVSFTPPFINDLGCVYLNQKKSSKDAISAYNKIAKSDTLISEISSLSQSITAAKELDAFESLLLTHEKLLASHLNIPTIKESLFNDFSKDNGQIKSLGAWGGDFILVTQIQKNIPYFKSKGYETILKLSDLKLTF